MYLHIPDAHRKKLDHKGEKCIFLGVSNQSKTYKLYNLNTKKIVNSRDIIFDEDTTGPWNKKEIQQHIPVDFEEEKQQEMETDQSLIPPILAQPSISAHTQEVDRPQRIRRQPAWMGDYEVTGIDRLEDSPIHFALFLDCDPNF